MLVAGRDDERVMQLYGPCVVNSTARQLPTADYSAELEKELDDVFHQRRVLFRWCMAVLSHGKGRRGAFYRDYAGVFIAMHPSGDVIACCADGMVDKKHEKGEAGTGTAQPVLAHSHVR